MAEPTEPAPGLQRCTVEDGTEDRLIREEPMLIRIHDQSLLTMRTPGADEDLVLGFLLGEGLLSGASDVEEIRSIPGGGEGGEPDAVEVRLRAGLRQQIAGRLARTHEIRSSCGLCGLADADELLEGTPPLLPGVPRLPRKRISELLQALQDGQELFRATGACHGAALFGPDGSAWAIGEDVGRHNALDKVIGRAAQEGRELSQATVLLSGRAGFDLVLKCLHARIPIILSVSATSALSFDVCRSAGATLVGFVRGSGYKVYTDGGRRLDGDA